MAAKLLIINTSSDESLVEYVELLSDKLSHLEAASNIVHYKYLNGIKLSEYNGIILSPTSIDDDKSDTKKSEENWTSKLKYVLKLITCNLPMLGICGGHLMLGLLFGRVHQISRHWKVQWQRAHLTMKKISDAPQKTGFSLLRKELGCPAWNS